MVLMVNLKSIEKEAAKQSKRLERALKVVRRLDAVGALGAWLNLSCNRRTDNEVLHKVAEPKNKFEFTATTVRYWSPFAECWFVWRSTGASNQFYEEKEEIAE